MTRRTWTLLTGLVIAVALGVVGATVKVPYVVLGPGPTYNTLGAVGGTTVVAISGQPTYPATGHLNMTTVGVTDDITLFGALGYWFSSKYGVVPREEVFPPGKSDKEVNEQNTQDFQKSESDAEVAALSYLDLPGTVFVVDVTAGGPAAGALRVGDRILAIDGHAVRNAADLQDRVRATAPGQRVTVRVQRGSPPAQDVPVVVGSRADAKDQGLLGIALDTRYPVDVAISLSDIGGPSAGLMFALAIVDKLTPGALTGGRFVAGTGVISAAGDVGPIGGIQFKMAAARKAGATVFLVPSRNCAEAKQRTPKGLQLVKVDSLRAAVDSLTAIGDDRPVPAC